MFHILDTTVTPPAKLNDPFSYEPHELTLLAADLLREHLHTLVGCEQEIAAGKMFGVLVCRDDSGRLGFLAAYSGQIGGRADWPWFVPAVFNYLQPDGYFKQEESRITAINRQVEAIEQSHEYLELTTALQRVQADGTSAVNDYRTYMQTCKQRRDELRATTNCDKAALIAESQFQKAELRRIKKRWQEKADAAAQRLRPLTDRLGHLKQERKQRSDALQQWLFDHFLLLNHRGERRSLSSIFSTTPQGTPPSGAGECCAPKLLHYAFLHHLQPLCMGEFWQGRSPQMEVRHHGQFYPACRGKCKPILEWMLDIPSHVGEGSGMEDDGIKIIYEDESIIVVSKPSGLLSVPGRQGLPSVESILGERYGQVFMPHRLDQDTSGLLVVARTLEAYRCLQRQFLLRTVSKEYEALLDGVTKGEGDISLPLRPDLNDRPRQLVDYVCGKAAQTHYHIINVENGQARVLLVPHTGRTHQLRVHCAHQEGLGIPIVGDALYGKGSGTRLCLHARMLAFRHPATMQELRFANATPF